MQVTILGKTIPYSNLPENVEQLKAYIRGTMNEGNLFLNSMEIDQMKIYDRYFEHILEHILEIKEISVELLTNDEYAHEILLTTQEYLAGALPALSMLADEFYRLPNSETWQRFDQLLEGIQWITGLIDTFRLDIAILKDSRLVEYCENLQLQLIPLIEAMEQKDNALIADILNYEVHRIYNDLHASISQTIDNEVAHHDIS